MKTTNVIKKMVAVGTGLAMVGATILGASAGTLADYPSPFVKAGMPAANLAVVVGDKADAQDVVGMGDILGALQTASVSTISTGTSDKKTTNWLQGDVTEIGGASDLLELSEELNEVKDSFSGELKALASGKVTTDKGSTDYNQYIKFNDDTDPRTDNSAAGAIVFAKDDNDLVGDFLYWGSNQQIFEYQMIFSDGFASKETAGALKDLEGETISMLGNQLTLVNADLSKSGADIRVTLDFMTGSAKLVLEEGETKTVTIGDKEYTVQVKVISETANAGDGAVSLVVNGEATDQLTSGDTDHLKDGTELGVSDIIATGKDTQKSIVVLYLGAFKVHLEDSTSTANSFDGRLEVNNEFIRNANVRIRGTETVNNSEYEINDINIRALADPKDGSDLYVAPRNAPMKGYPTTTMGVRSYLDEPDSMIVPGWDIVFDSMTETGWSDLNLNPSGDSQYRIEFTNQEGLKYNVPYLSAEPTNNVAAVNGFATGDSSRRLHWIEPDAPGAGTTAAAANLDDDNEGTAPNYLKVNFVIPLKDWFVLSDCTSTDNTCNTHVMRYDSYDNSSSKLSFTDLAGGSKEVTFQRVDDTAAATADANVDFGFSDQLVVGGKTYNVWVATNGDSDVFKNIFVDLNGDGNVQNTDVAFVGIKGLGILDLGRYCSASNSSRTGIFDADDDGFQNASTNDCGNITLADTDNVVRYDTTVFPTVNDTTDREENALALVTLADQFDEGQPEGGDAGENLVEYFQFVGRANNEMGLLTGPSLNTSSNGSLNSVTFGVPNQDDVNNGVNNRSVLMGSVSPENDNNLRMSTDVYGASFEQHTSSDSTTAELQNIHYPLDQRGGHVYLTFGSTTSGSSSSGGSQQVNPIPVGASKLASEVADIMAWNAIVVGGPCANPVSAKLMGNPEPCYQAIPENKALIKLYEQTNGNMALLVAGRTALNTRQAARALATGMIKTVGQVKEAFVSGATLTDIQVSAV